MFGGETMEGSLNRALVVEDDPVLRRSLVRGIRRWGLETLEAHDVRSARRMLRCEPDLVVTDVRLPDGTGHEVARRASRMHTPPLVVAMSGEATAAEAFELGRASVRLYLEKPFTLEELERRIRAIQTLGHGGSAPFRSEGIPPRMRNAMLEALRRLAIERGLTPRESDVLRLVLAGTPRAELPHAMGVSKNTCKTLVRGALRKCELTRMAQLAAFVLARVEWGDSPE